jgi:hypothetical protein
MTGKQLHGINHAGLALVPRVDGCCQPADLILLMLHCEQAALPSVCLPALCRAAALYRLLSTAAVCTVNSHSSVVLPSPAALVGC